MFLKVTEKVASPEPAAEEVEPETESKHEPDSNEETKSNYEPDSNEETKSTDEIKDQDQV